MRFGSIRAKLTVWYTAVLSCGLILLSLTIWLMLRHALYSDLSASLTSASQGLGSYLKAEGADREFNLVREASEFSTSIAQPHLMAIYDLQRQPQYASAELQRCPNVLADGRPEPLNLNHTHYVAAMRNVRVGQQSYLVLLAMPSGAIEGVVHRVGFALLVIVPLFVLGGSLGGLWLSREALAPVDAITKEARAIGLSNLAGRLPVSQTGDELQRLTETWNEMLTRLEAAVGEVTQFTADASHELRTPIAVVRLAAESALKKSRSETEYRDALQRIQDASESMGRLLEDLLFLARADAGQGARAWEIIQPASLVEAACQDLQPLAERKRVLLRNEVGGASVPVAGDPAALRRATVILVDNAIKYSPEESVVTVSVQQDGDRLCIRVADSGGGIPAGLQGRLFERFFRADESRSKDSGGFGLGLAIARSILQQHSGALSLEQSSDAGSVFLMSLPVAG